MHFFFVVVIASITAVYCSGEKYDVITFLPRLCGSEKVLCLCNVINFSKCDVLSSQQNAAMNWGAESNLNVAGNSTPSCANASVYLMILSEEWVKALKEQVMLSITTIAGVMVELTEQLNWGRVTILADVSDPYFLQTAKMFYKMANSTSDFTFMQLGRMNSEIEDTLNKIEQLNLKIIVVSLRASIAHNILCMAQERHLVWPEYGWIVHSVEVSNQSCGSFFLEGVITVYERHWTGQTLYIESSKLGVDDFAALELLSCHLGDHSLLHTEFTGMLYQWRESSEVMVAQYSRRNSSLSLINIDGPIPSDLPPQFSPVVFIALYYVGISFCFFVVTVTMVLYFYYHKEPEVKATSVSLSIFMFLGCYMLIFYLCVLNSTLLPSYHKLSSRVRNFFCVFRVWIHGLGFPIALILSTLLVKLVRVYRIFNCYGKLGKCTSGNATLAFYVLLLASPNFLICLIWSTGDHYLSTVSLSVEEGYLLVTEQCVSDYTIQWLMGLLIYFIIMCVLLVVVAVLTRKVKHKNFKDSKKTSALSFTLVLTLSIILSYWYILRVIRAHVVLVHAVLQIGHYFVILECVGLIFFPKLFPIVKKQLIP